MDADPAHALSSIIMVQSVKGAGERNSPQTCQHDESKDSVCFERMGMGDLEAADIANAGVQSVVVPEGRVAAGGMCVSPTEAWPPTMPLGQPSVSCCFMEWAPADSSDDDDVGLLDAVDHNAIHEAMGMPRAPTPAATQAALARSKLSITNTSLISLPAPALQEEVAVLAVQEEGLGDKAPELACGQYDDADLEGLLEESEDELSLKAPTPDNTPVNSPPGEAYSGLVSHPDSALLSSTLNDMVCSGVARAQSYGGSSTPSPDATPRASPGTSPTGTLSRKVSTLGRVWSRILGRNRGGSKKAATGSPVASPPPPRCLTDSEDDEVGEENLPGLEVDSHAIDELEATLEEVRLDGDGDDPVVSYLVEEAEDVARPQAAASGDVTVEEVHDEDDGDDSREDADPVGQALVEPTPRPSGLLSRLFSRSRTSQDATSSDPAGGLQVEAPGTGAPTESTEAPGRTARAKERGTGLKRGRAEVSSRDHLHRLKPRQSNKAAVRGSLPRILSRWLRQAEARAESGAWGAEGDAGETVVEGVSPCLGLGAALGAAHRGRQPSQPPALARPRRTQPSIESRDTRSRKNVEDELLHEKHQGTKSMQDEKLVSDFGSQAGESMLPKSTSFQSQESRDAEASFVVDASDYI